MKMLVAPEGGNALHGQRFRAKLRRDPLYDEYVDGIQSWEEHGEKKRDLDRDIQTLKAKSVLKALRRLLPTTKQSRF